MPFEYNPKSAWRSEEDDPVDLNSINQDIFVDVPEW